MHILEIYMHLLNIHQAEFPTFLASEKFMMAMQRSMVFPKNEGPMMILFKKWEEMANNDTYMDHLDASLSKSYWNLYDHKECICDLKDAKKI